MFLGLGKSLTSTSPIFLLNNPSDRFNDFPVDNIVVSGFGYEIKPVHIRRRFYGMSHIILNPDVRDFRGFKYRLVHLAERMEYDIVFFYVVLFDSHYFRRFDD